MLRLREFEKYGLLVRWVYLEVLFYVEYFLMEKGL